MHTSSSAAVADTPADALEVQTLDARACLASVQHTLAEQLIGHDLLVERLLIALLTGGHVLIEGPPGVAKTRTINRFAELLDARFVRVQATPDLLPADITGSDMYHPQSGEFRFLPGPLFNNVVLVDEINRAPPKVQSALLEAMGERQITTGGTTRTLDEPFMVAATQNPIEHEGTYPLPEAQLDRFLFFLEIGLPNVDRERQILDRVLDEFARETTTSDTTPLANAHVLRQARRDINNTFLSPAVRDYIVRLVGATRGHGAGATAATDVAQAASPRGSINLAVASRALAWLQRRDHVTPDDVASLAPDVLAGRIALDYRARAEGQLARTVILDILEATPQV